MTEFFIFLKLGYQHITDINGYDHILFVVALCAIYRITDWKKVLVLVTAFTIGHSITLALAALNIIEYSTELIEFLIPVTIIFTCITNLFHKSSDNALAKEDFSPVRYVLALGFGLIHGMGFSNYLRSLLGKDENIIPQLLAFNIGLEFGQIFIIAIAMGLGFLIMNVFKVKKHTWNLILSSFVAGVAFKLMTEKWFF
ncbi:HupE/UreJ family protein [Emticicia sp. C21]|uniref:HupE/UreJ family protein n=1 Tax=Emticicia sp. C21 TaxID=2302915 RepID=UPI000E34E048|nr:HupE/UreJ family protein [Emticicia sp. C21]RFS17161.1 HupE/UreJ family protein [Emticicia sp. C21]